VYEVKPPLDDLHQGLIVRLALQPGMRLLQALHCLERLLVGAPKAQLALMTASLPLREGGTLPALQVCSHVLAHDLARPSSLRSLQSNSAQALVALDLPALLCMLRRVSDPQTLLRAALGARNAGECAAAAMVLQAFCKGNAEGQSMLIATIMPAGNHGLEGSGARQAFPHPLSTREHYSLPVTEAYVWAEYGLVGGLPYK